MNKTLNDFFKEFYADKLKEMMNIPNPFIHNFPYYRQIYADSMLLEVLDEHE